MWGGAAVSEGLIEDVMADTGVDRTEAIRIAKSMVGADTVATITLPRSEHATIRLAIATTGQWRTVSFGMAGARPVALDMTAVDVTARWLGITPSPHLFEGLAIIEREALKVMRTAQ